MNTKIDSTDDGFVGESVLDRLAGLPKPPMFIHAPIRIIIGCVRFTVGSGGAPEIPDGIELVEGRETAKYPTVRNGWAYGWEGYVRCEENAGGTYTTPSGVTFRWDYRRGDAEAFDTGRFEVMG